MALLFGENAAVRSCDGEEAVPRGQRVLSGLSGVRAKGWVSVQSKVTDTVSVEIAGLNVALP
jgi:hypothetical protein